MADRVVVLVVAHGSRAQGANDAHLAQVAAVADRSGLDVAAAFLELAAPSIPEAIEGAVASGATRVVLLPHFLAPGRHVTEHLPAAVAAATVRHRDVVIDLAAASGDDPAMTDLLVALVRSASAGEGEGAGDSA